MCSEVCDDWFSSCRCGRPRGSRAGAGSPLVVCGPDVGLGLCKGPAVWGLRLGWGSVEFAAEIDEG